MRGGLHRRVEALICAYDEFLMSDSPLYHSLPFGSVVKRWLVDEQYHMIVFNRSSALLRLDFFSRGSPRCSGSRSMETLPAGRVWEHRRDWVRGGKGTEGFCSCKRSGDDITKAKVVKQPAGLQPNGC